MSGKTSAARSSSPVAEGRAIGAEKRVAVDITYTSGKNKGAYWCALYRRKTNSGAYTTGFASTISNNAHPGRASRPPPAEQADGENRNNASADRRLMMPPDMHHPRFGAVHFINSSSAGYSTALRQIRMALCQFAKTAVIYRRHGTAFASERRRTSLITRTQNAAYSALTATNSL